ncbi:TerB family tellurite resistance protein [Ramlibacter sp. MMS24-I3-19]|uniref:tellurite resistance TerB family protein n=1 Tax=Ramlibacter sp. MMS24-I3-19 TaxID=3416606 RepID=UPI003D021E5F
MFAAFKEFLDEIAPSTGAPRASGAPSLRLAAAVLLMEVMRARDGISPLEREVGAQALQEQFGLAPEEVASLLQVAERESMTAYDYFRFTNPLDEQLPQPQKIALVEAMWRVAYADGDLRAEENTVVSKVADLLHVSHGEYIAAKMRAKPADATRH